MPAARRPSTAGVVGTLSAPPQKVQPSVSVRTSSPRASASSWATIPPIEIPSTCADSMPSPSSSPAASPASCAIVKGPSRRLLAPTPRWS
jgi:hypothetical protein